MGEGFDARLGDGDVLKVELVGGGAKEFGFASARFDERDVPGGFGDGDREARSAAAAADIDKGFLGRWCVAQKVEDVLPADEGFGDEAFEQGVGVLDAG